MALFTFVASTKAKASEVNSNFSSFKVNQIYTGTGFDSSATLGSDTQSHELTAISSANLFGADYLIIKVMAFCDSSNVGSVRSSRSNLKIEAKEIGGSYSTIFNRDLKDFEDEDGSELTQHVEYYHTLTSGEKTNGIQIQISTTSTDSVGTTSTSNVQTVLLLGA